MAIKPLCSDPAVLLIADDLTGACDSAVAFVKAGLSASVRLSGGGGGADVLAIAAETRNLAAPEAGARIAALEPLRSFAGPCLFHKVDSAGRGHPGEEMLAMQAIGGCGGIVWAPAHPAAGRTVEDGLLRVRELTGAESVIDLAGLLPPEARERIERIGAGGGEDLLRRMLEARGRGRDIWLLDAVTAADLSAIADAALSLPLRPLWTGSAGLAEAIAGRRVPAGCPEVPAPPAPGRTLVLSGTSHGVTLRQLRRLEREAAPLSLEDDSPPPAFDRAVLRLDWSRASGESLLRLWARLCGAGAPSIRTLVLTGGDTAAFVLRALGTGALRLGGEVEQGVVWSLAEGGLADGCTVITKSGGFGGEDALARAAGVAIG